MRNILKLCYLANIILAIASLFILPDPTATHFAFGGLPDNWGPPSVSAMIFVVISTLFFAITIFVPFMINRIPIQYVNMPNKGYWQTMENKPEAVKKIKRFMVEFGVASLAFILCINLQTIKANLSVPVMLREKSFFTVLVAFMLYMIYWCVKLFMAFRVPKDSPYKLT